MATARTDGRPHVAPVWIDLEDDDTIVFNTGESTIKGRNLARDPRVCLSVDDDEPPFTFVVAQGLAQLSADLGEVRRWAGRLGGRYLGPDQAEAMARRNGVPGELLVRVRVSSWVGMSRVSD